MTAETPGKAFEPARIERETFVADIEIHEQLTSTNDRALALADSIERIPKLVVALSQTGGRGRGSNRWWASEGALTFSLLLEPARVEKSRWPQLSLAVGVGVCGALEQLLPAADMRLKWPNDVYVNGAKICGILVEVPPKQPGRIVAGIGINVNNSLAGAPEELRNRATSIRDVICQHARLEDVLIAVLNGVEQSLEQLVRRDAALPQAWRRMCYLTGRSVSLNDGARVISGTCQGIEDDGALLLQTEAGPRRCYGGVVEVFE